MCSPKCHASVHESMLNKSFTFTEGFSERGGSSLRRYRCNTGTQLGKLNKGGRTSTTPQKNVIALITNIIRRVNILKLKMFLALFNPTFTTHKKMYTKQLIGLSTSKWKKPHLLHYISSCYFWISLKHIPTSIFFYRWEIVRIQWLLLQKKKKNKKMKGHNLGKKYMIKLRDCKCNFNQLSSIEFTRVLLKNFVWSSMKKICF